MIIELIEKLFGLLSSDTKNPKSARVTKQTKSIKNASLPFELKSKNVIVPDDKNEKEIQALYAEIRELQAENREKINKNKFASL